MAHASQFCAAQAALAEAVQGGGGGRAADNGRGSQASLFLLLLSMWEIIFGYVFILSPGVWILPG